MSVWVSWSTWTMSTVEPSAFVIFSFRYLPRPSCVIPRWTGTFELGQVALDELQRVVLAREDRLGEVLADLVRVDVERRRELDVGDVVAAEVDVHEAGDGLGRVGVAVVVDALDEGGCAVADADDRDADLVVLVATLPVGRRAAPVGAVLAHVVTSKLKSRLEPRGGAAVTAGPGGSAGRAHARCAARR